MSIVMELQFDGKQGNKSEFSTSSSSILDDELDWKIIFEYFEDLSLLESGYHLFH